MLLSLSLELPHQNACSMLGFSKLWCNRKFCTVLHAYIFPSVQQYDGLIMGENEYAISLIVAVAASLIDHLQIVR